MRQSFEEWLDFFREKPKLGMGYLAASKSRIAEVFKRRNLIVHNGGRVNRRYLHEVEQDLRVGLSLGDVVEISSDYLNASIDLIELQFVLIAAELWKKLEAADNERGDLLVRLAFQGLLESRWAMARGLSHFVINDKNGSEATRLRAQINYWQSFKWSGEYEAVKDEVEKFDFSAKDPLFQLAHAAIREDCEGFFRMLPGVLDSGKLSRDQLLTWPLFQNLRKRDEFAPYAPAQNAERTETQPPNGHGEPSEPVQ